MEVERIYDAAHAHIVRGFLESHGITCTLFGEEHNRIAWHLQIALGGIRLMVAAQDAEQARTLLREQATKIKESDQKTLLPPTKKGLFYTAISSVILLFSGVPMPLKTRKADKNEDDDHG